MTPRGLASTVGSFACPVSGLSICATLPDDVRSAHHDRVKSWLTADARSIGTRADSALAINRR
jgi:hypothetical protein